MGLLTRVLGRIAPQLRTVSDWVAVYQQILGTLPGCAHTLAHRRNYVKAINGEFGQRAIASVRPHEIAAFIRQIHATRPFQARRVLIEARSIFDAAISYGWVDSNPATAVKQLPTKVKRRRMTLAQWQRMHDAASSGSWPTWLAPLLELALVSGQRRADLQKMGVADVWAHENGSEYLHVVQQKTGTRLALPLALRLDAVGLSLGDVITRCRDYAPAGETFVRKRGGGPLVTGSLSARFCELFIAANGPWEGEGAPPSLHETRSLSERLYRAHGIDTKTLLGHARQSMTDQYNDDRGLHRTDWKVLLL